MTIDDATAMDAEAILDLQRAAYQSEARLYSDFNIPPLRESLDELSALFSTHLFLKAVVDGRIVGSVRARSDGTSCFIGRLIVAPAHQGRGVGSRLMEAIEARFPAVERFELFTGHKSEFNLRFYEKRGYREFMREPASDRVTMVFMEKENRPEKAN
jgi:GNAT superfamily N-acetyltransferase